MRWSDVFDEDVYGLTIYNLNDHSKEFGLDDSIGKGITDIKSIKLEYNLNYSTPCYSCGVEYRHQNGYSTTYYFYLYSCPYKYCDKIQAHIEDILYKLFKYYGIKYIDLSDNYLGLVDTLDTIISHIKFDIEERSIEVTYYTDLSKEVEV